MKLSACMIVRDASPDELTRAIQSIRPHVDEVVLVDTGSLRPVRPEGVDVYELFTGCNATEDCPPQAKCACRVGDMLDFSMARNRSFELASGDWLTWLDADDEVIQAKDAPPLKDLVPKDGTGCVHFPYEYSYDSAGNVTSRCYLQRLVHRDTRWGYPIHEVLYARGFGKSDAYVWKHRRRSMASKAAIKRNLRIAQHHAFHTPEKYINDNRYWFYLGQGFSDDGKPVHAAECYQKSWDLENDPAQKFLIAERMVYITLPDIAVDWAWRAIALKPDYPSAWIALCNALYRQADEAHKKQEWAKRYEISTHIVRFGEFAQTLPDPNTIFFTDPSARFVKLYENLQIAYNWVDRPEDALRACKDGLKAGQNKLLEWCRDSYLAYFARRGIETGIEVLQKMRFNEAAREETKLARAAIERYLPPVVPVKTPIVLKKVAPKVIIQEKAPEDPLAFQNNPRKLSVIFALPPSAVETWNPETAETSGIAGSEMALIEMSKRLAAKGHSVVVYSPSCGDEKTYDGVQYIPQLPPHGVGCDVYVAWKSADLLELSGYAERRCLWVHDVCAWNVSQKNIRLADHVIVQSEFHKTCVMQYHGDAGLREDQVFVSRSGIDTKRFRGADVKKENIAVYTSSPDRGLEQLVDVWPQIEAAVPGAQLHVFYGFNNWDKFAEMSGDTITQERIRKIKTTIFESKSISLMGRLPRAEYIKELWRSKVWLYPAWQIDRPFHETSCVSCMEAWAAGLHLVCPSWGALKETGGKAGAHFYDAPSEDWGGQKEVFVKMAVEALHSQVNLGVPSDMFDWSGVVDQWLKLFLGETEAVKPQAILPEYEGTL